MCFLLQKITLFPSAHNAEDFQKLLRISTIQLRYSKTVQSETALQITRRLHLIGKWIVALILTSSELLNDVTSTPFRSLLLNSVSSTVLTVFVEFPSTSPSVERPWAVNLANRNGIRDPDFAFGVDCNQRRRMTPRIYKSKTTHKLVNAIGRADVVSRNCIGLLHICISQGKAVVEIAQ